MEENYVKFCYDDYPHYKLHHTIETCAQHSIPAHLHYDTSLVLTYYKRGTGSIRVEGQFYPIHEGEIVLLNPYELHVCTVDSNIPHERLALYINDSILDSFNCKKHTFFNSFYERKNGTRNLICVENVEKYGIGELLERILKRTKEDTTESIILATCSIIELLATLNQVLELQTQSEITDYASDKRINDIIRYLNQNYDKDLSVEMIAERFYFSKYHLCRLFKKYVGATIWEYLIYRRLIAFNLLVCQGHTLEEACYQVGFHNYSNFFRLYKKYMDITPAYYKQKALQK